MNAKIFSKLIAKFNFARGGIILILFFVLSIDYHAVSQNIVCGTPSIALDNSPTSNNPPTGPFFVKVYLHVVTKSDFSGGLTKEDVEKIIPDLNSAFNSHNIYFSLGCVNYINNTSMYFNDGNILYYNLSTSSQYFINDGINIFLIPDGVNNPFFYKGYANSIPGKSCYVYYNQNSLILAHEVGHCLGLYHTFHGTCEEPGNWAFADPSQTNCSPVPSDHINTGDMVADTPPDDKNFISCDVQGTKTPWCTGTGISSCCDPNGQLFYKSDPKNIMSYSNCRQYFTAGQGERMRDKIPQSILIQVPSVIVQNTSITSNVEITTDIYIKAPNKLTVDGATVFMKPGRKIFVEGGNNTVANAELIVKNQGKITRSLVNNSESCNDMTKSHKLWDGIELGAGVNKSGGVVTLTNAFIEYARKAIRISPSNQLNNRGKCEAFLTTFTNNNLSVFNSNESNVLTHQSFRFNTCTFLRDNSYTEDVLVGSSNKPIYDGQINMRLASGILYMQKCTLRDDHTDKADVSTHFRVFQSPLNLQSKNVYNNGRIGIEIFGIDNVAFNTIRDNDFNSHESENINVSGLYSNISSNRFHNLNGTIGVLLNNTSSFRLFGNTFDGGFAGVDITNGSSTPTTFAKNSFSNHFGQSNRFVGANNGVLLKCNIYNNTTSNNIINTGQLNSIQGSKSQPAGNTYLDGSSNFDIISSSQNISYYYDENVSSEEPINNTNITKNSTNYHSNCDQITDFTSIADAQTEYQERKSAYDFQRGNLGNMVDGGNTSNVMNIIQNANQNNAATVKNNLLNLSPFLSNEVIKRFFDRSDIFSNTDRTDIISSNSHILLDQSMIDYITQSNLSYPLSSLNSIPVLSTQRLALESEINFQFFGMHNAINGAINLLSVEDTINFDTLRLWLGRLNNFQGHLMIASTYYKEALYNDWQNYVNNIPNIISLTTEQSNELNSYKSMYSLLINAMNNGRNYANLTQTEVSQLNTIAVAANNTSNQFAKNFLIEFYGFQFGSNSNQKTGIPVNKIESSAVVKSGSDAILIYPNPASGTLNIRVEDELVNQSMEVGFYNNIGTLVKYYKLNINKLNSINIQEIPSGVYHIHVVTPNQKQVSKILVHN